MGRITASLLCPLFSTRDRSQVNAVRPSHSQFSLFCPAIVGAESMMAGGEAATRLRWWRSSSYSYLATAALLLLAVAPRGAMAVWLSLPASGTKCVSEEIQPNVVVLADYSVIYEDSSHGVPTIGAKVTSPYGNTLYHKEGETIGQFAFTTSEAGNYLACFWIDSGNKDAGATVSLDWKIGIAAKDWDSVAKKEKIEGVELELTKLAAAVQAIHNNLLYLKSREAEMREVSERTNSRIAWLSIMSLSVCIVVSVLQLWHLKGFFQKKKLI